MNPEKVQALLIQMRSKPTSIRFADLQSVCEMFFGKPRQTSGSHLLFKTPWLGDPRINIQNDKGSAKAYQVKQVLAAIAKLERQE